MAIQHNKYKLRDVSKDTGMKSSDITDMLVKYCGTNDKINGSSSLSDAELNVVFENFTQQQQKGTIEEYFNTYDEALRQKNEKKEIETEIAKPSQNTENVKKIEKNNSDSIKIENKNTEIKSNNQSVKSDINKNEKINIQNNRNVSTADVKNNNDKSVVKNNISSGNNTENYQNKHNNIQNNVQRVNQYNGVEKRNFPNRSENYNRNKPFTDKRPQTQDIRRTQANPVKPNVHTPIVNSKNQPDRKPAAPMNNFSRPNVNNVKTNVNNVKKPAKKQELKRADFKPRTSTQAGVTILDSDTSTQQGQVHVDTRTKVNVNLAKYDERLNDIIGDKANRDYGKSKQKIKQKSKQRGNFRREDESAKLKRLEQYEKDKKKILENVVLPESISVSDLAAKLRMTNAEIVKKLMLLGVMASASQIIDYDTAALVAEDLGAKVTKEVVVTIEDKLIDDSVDKDEDLVTRPPVVVVMGHVDHGKTSILDAIRHTAVTEGEAGGITQHIGAYQVTAGGRNITFLDTPGHAAFTAMRARGAQATDIAILVVAGDDGIMPQTIEAINHAKAAKIPIIVAVNKMDKHEADFDRVLQDLTKYELVPEQWGGDVICLPVSAHTKMGIDDLLENILLVADVQELKANPDRDAKGTVIEAKLDKSRGPVATLLVQNGTLHSGDIIVAGTSVGRVRVMSDDKGQKIKNATPSMPVEVVGLSEVPSAGDIFHAVKDEKMARELVEQRKQEAKDASYNDRSRVTLDDLFNQIQQGQMKTLNIIIKADVQGSAEAVKSSLEKLSNSEVRVNVIHSAVGSVSESDIMLASASNAIIVGFNIRPDNNAKALAEKDGVDIRLYRVIYDCIDEIESAMKGMLAPKFKEVSLGTAEVRQTFKVTGVGTIAGSYVKTGKIVRTADVRLIRDGIVVYEGKIDSLKRFKDDAKEVQEGYECGIGLDKFNDIKDGDIIEAYTNEEIKQ